MEGPNDIFTNAVKDSNYQLTESLLQIGGFDVNKLCMEIDIFLLKHTGTVLHYAAHKGDTRMVELLLTYNADINTTNTSCGRTPLYLAARTNHKDTIKVLLRYQADINMTTIGGSTALHIAVINGHVNATELLIKSGANVNHVNSNGDTALHWAALLGHTKYALLLLQHGADVTLTNKDGDTALMVAKMVNNKAIADVIIRFTNDTTQGGQEPHHEVHTVRSSRPWSNNQRSLFGSGKRYSKCHDDPMSDETDATGTSADDHEGVTVNVPSGSSTRYTPVMAMLSENKSELLLPQVNGNDNQSTNDITYETYTHDPNHVRTLHHTPLIQVTTSACSMPVTGEPTETKLKDLACQIGYEWVPLALELEIPSKETEQIKMNPSLDPKGWIIEMLMRWRANVHNKTEKERRQILKSALISVGRKDLSNLL